MHNKPAGILSQELGSKQADNIIPLDKATVMVEEETAIEITVPGNAKIGFVFFDGINGGGSAFDQHWIRYAIREIAIGLVLDLYEFERQMRFQQINCWAGDTVA
jgi:hypothetical protein